MSDDETIMTDMPSVRVGDQDVSAVGHETLIVGNYDVYSQKGIGINIESLPINIFTDVMGHEVNGTTTHYMDLQNGPHEPVRGISYNHKFPMSRIEFGVVNKPDVSGTRLQPILGMNYFMQLTDKQKLSLFV
jgi:hypothetical protein